MTNILIDTRIEELRALEAAAAELAKKADAIKNQLKAELDERKVDSLDTGRHKVFYSAYQKSSVDSARLKEEGLYNRFLKTSTVIQFKITDAKANA